MGKKGKRVPVAPNCDSESVGGGETCTFGLRRGGKVGEEPRVWRFSSKVGKTYEKTEKYSVISGYWRILHQRKGSRASSEKRREKSWGKRVLGDGEARPANIQLAGVIKPKKKS